MTRRKTIRPPHDAWGPVIEGCRSVLLLKLGSVEAVDALVDEATNYVGGEGETLTVAAVQHQQADVARALLRQVERAQDFAARHPESDIARLLAPLEAAGLRALADERPQSGRPPGRRPALLTWPRALALDLNDRQIGALALLVASHNSEPLPKSHRATTPADRLRDEAKAIKRARETMPWIINERRRLLAGGPREVTPLVTRPAFPGLGLAAAAPPRRKGPDGTSGVALESRQNTGENSSNGGGQK